MKILQLCKKFPYPLTSGEAIAVTYLSKALHKQGCEITLLAMNTTKHFVDINSLPENFNHYKEIHTVLVDNKITPGGAIKNLFSSGSFHVDRYRSEDFAQKLKDLLIEHRYDIIQLETMYLSPYMDLIRAHSEALLVMRAHNIEHEIWQRISRNTKFLPKRWYLNYLSSKLERFELSVLNDYDFLVPISEKDLQKYRNLGYMNGAKTIPIGLDINDYKMPINSRLDTMSLSFIGGFDWFPNKEGVLWFLDRIWPDIHREFPLLKLYIAGRQMPDSLYRYKNKNVYALGDVEDSRAFMAQHTATLVPLLSGSGTRVKILEGMALGRIVVTTSLGLEGIPAQHGEELLIADDLDGFREAIRFLADTEAVLQMRKKARQFIYTRYNNELLAEDLTAAFSKYISTHT